jgi:hypothetical protein
MNGALGFDKGWAVFGALSEWNDDFDFARLLTQCACDSNLVRLANPEWGHRRRRVLRPVDGEQHVAPLDASEVGWTAVKYV